MTTRYGLIPFSSIFIGCSATALLVFITFFSFSSYVFYLQKNAVSLLNQAIFSAESIHALKQPDAVKAGLRFSSIPFRPELFVVFVDGSHRVTLFRDVDKSGVVRTRVNIRGRVDRSGDPQSTDTFSRIIVSSAGACGLQTLRAGIGDLEIDISLNQGIFSKSVESYLPFLCITIILTALLSVFSVRVLAAQALQPLREVTTALELLAIGNFTPQFVNINEKGRLRFLAAAYNGAVEQVQTAFGERDKAHASMQRFIADAGHQLRTPLTVIRGYISILRQGDINDFTSILDAMHQQCLLISALIERLILLEQWEENVASPAQIIDLGNLVEEIIAPIAQSRPDRLLTVNAADHVYAAVDQSDLRHAVANIVDNALKYTRGSITVQVKVLNDRAFLEIADEGPGMKPEHAEHAFDRFFRGDRRDIEGSGLGLAIAKRAIERANGQIFLDADVKRGTCFRISFPRKHSMHENKNH